MDMGVLVSIFLALLAYIPVLMVVWFGIHGSRNTNGHQAVLWWMALLGIPLAWLLVGLDGVMRSRPLCQGGSVGFLFWGLFALGGFLIWTSSQQKSLMLLYLGRLSLALAPTTLFFSLYLTGFC